MFAFLLWSVYKQQAFLNDLLKESPEGAFCSYTWEFQLTPGFSGPCTVEFHLQGWHFHSLCEHLFPCILLEFPLLHLTTVASCWVSLRVGLSLVESIKAFSKSLLHVLSPLLGEAALPVLAREQWFSRGLPAQQGQRGLDLPRAKAAQKNRVPDVETEGAAVLGL